MAILLTILFLLAPLGANSNPTTIGASNTSRTGAVQTKGVEAQMAQGGWSGGFVDSGNLEAMKDWARGMCRGVDLNQTAKSLNVEPNIKTVAKALIGNSSDDPNILKAAQQACEQELRKTKNGE
jgi:hypothetical protein